LFGNSGVGAAGDARGALVDALIEAVAQFAIVLDRSCDPGKD
jgi:hypothetical protein